jgi:RNA polymerase-associated protein CTR9
MEILLAVLSIFLCRIGYLRLFAMAHAQGHLTEAAEQLQEVFNVDQKHLTAWSMFGQMHLEKEEWGAAQKKFERILENVDKKDSFALIALGNMYYNAKFEKKEKEERYLKLALDFYWRVLQNEPKNIYAANGTKQVPSADLFIALIASS